MAEIELRILGAFALLRDGAPVSPLPGRKAQALVAYLALRGGRLQNREHLAALLWGDRQDEQARQSLRQAVSALRKAMGDSDGKILVSDGDGLRLDIRAVTVDALSFERAASAIEPERLREGLALFHGDLLASLAGIYEEFDQWVTAERLRFRGLAADALDRFTALAGDAAADPEIAAAAVRLLQLDPLAEPAHRALMRHYHARGQRAPALRQFEQLARLLRRELDADPDPETQQLHALIHSAPVPEKEPAEAGSALDALSNAARLARRLPRAAILAAAAGLVVIGIALGAWLTAAPTSTQARQEADSGPSAPARLDRTSIAVLPFRIVEKNERSAALALGLRQGLTTALSMISNLSVVPVAEADPAAPARSASETGRRLGARYVLEGTIQLADNSVRVTAALTDALERRITWTQLYHRPVDDIFSLQNELILNLATALQIELSEGEQARISLVSGTKNLEAWLLAGQALQEVRRLTPERILRARAFYEQALKLDPDYTGAKGGLAWTWLIGLLFDRNSDVEAALATASALGNDLARNRLSRAGGYGILSWVELMHGNHDRAILLGEKTIEANPAGADYIAQFAFVLTFAGEPERAIGLMERAMRLTPAPPDWYYWNLGRAQRLAGRHAEALASLRRARAEAQSPLYLVELTAALAAAGQDAEARRTAKRLLALRPEFSVERWVALPPYRNKEQTRKERALLVRAGLTL